ncbi:sentrin-specific protease-like [Ctenocephalides felis]|uniref:sentrin-specific protease-like n=1 Tax=Ctenocephalides felis TaxID=7515 RepID=UPI000E6E2061|nr:sentrin-specific protease-like [Ctenocephalides felis]
MRGRKEPNAKPSKNGKGDTTEAINNKTGRKRNVSPVTDHTEMTPNSDAQFDGSPQKKLKINDDKLQPEVVIEIMEGIYLVKEAPNEEVDAKIIRAIASCAFHKPIIEESEINISDTGLDSLNGTNWLEDTVINLYMDLLTQRGTEPGQLKVHAMNTFFLLSLQAHGYSSVCTWTKNVDIFTYDLMPIPVHVNGFHWCMLIIDFTHKSIKYYDSLDGSDQGVLDMMESYLKDESLDKKKIPLDTSTWTKEIVKDIPQQENGYDCGVFSCMFAEYICRGAKIDFSQNDMEYFRKKMHLEIVNGKLLT